MQESTNVEVQTRAFGFTVPLQPCIGYGTALEDEQKGEDGALDKRDSEQGVGDAAEPVRGEEADIEEKEGHFCHRNGSDVKDTANVENLQSWLLDYQRVGRVGEIRTLLADAT